MLDLCRKEVRSQKTENSAVIPCLIESSPDSWLLSTDSSSKYAQIPDQHISPRSRTRRAAQADHEPPAQTAAADPRKAADRDHPRTDHRGMRQQDRHQPSLQIRADPRLGSGVSTGTTASPSFPKTRSSAPEARSRTPKSSFRAATSWCTTRTFFWISTLHG